MKTAGQNPNGPAGQAEVRQLQQGANQSICSTYPSTRDFPVLWKPQFLR